MLALLLMIITGSKLVSSCRIAHIQSKLKLSPLIIINKRISSFGCRAFSASTSLLSSSSSSSCSSSPFSSCTSTSLITNGVRYNVLTDSMGNIEQIEKEEAMREKPFRIDFTSPAFQRRMKNSNSELVTKAMGKANLVIDLTAGLGRDSLMLAAAGKQVVMVEEQPVLVGLLRSALVKLSVDSTFGHISKRIHLVEGDSRLLEKDIRNSILGNLCENAVTSVYLDPMYPEKPHSRKSLVKKETQWLHILAAQFTDNLQESQYLLELFNVGKKLASDRIVVKRPLQAPYIIDNCKPHAIVSGRTQRFDIYMVNQLQGI